MHNLRDEEILIEHTKKTPIPRLPLMVIGLSKRDCQYYGHSWQEIGTAGAKCCTMCGITGYCPGCTPISPSEAAQPFYCTKYTHEYERREEEVQL